MITQISNHPRFKGRAQPNADSPRPAPITTRQASRVSSYIKILESLKSPADFKLSYSDRLIIARNLGRMLDQFRVETGLIATWLIKAEISKVKDYTKHLPKVAIYPNKVKPEQTGKGLMPKLGPYLNMAELAMRKQCPDMPDDELKTVLLDLIEGSSLDPAKDSQLQMLAPHERDIMESMSDLYLMLSAVGQRIITQYELKSYFRDIARWNLNSTDGGGTFETMAHPVSSLAGDPSWWDERVMLSPIAGLFDLTREEVPFLEALWQEKGSSLTKPIQFYHKRNVVFGVAPIGKNGQPVPVIGQLHICGGDLENEFISFYPDDLLHYWSCIVSNMPRDDADLHGESMSYSAGITYKYGKITPLAGGKVSSAWPNIQSQLEELTPMSLYKYLYDLPKQFDLENIREQLGMNFMGSATAVEGTPAAYIERILRYECVPGSAIPDGPLSIAGVLSSSAAYLKASLEQCVLEIRADLAENTEAFLALQNAKANKGEV